MAAGDTTGLKVPVIAAALAVLSALGSIAAMSWTVFQSQFAGVKELNEARVEALNARIDALNARIVVVETAIARGAREPVEKATLDAIVSALQVQITDENRQIAAALLAIESNTQAFKKPVPQ